MSDQLDYQPGDFPERMDFPYFDPDVPNISPGYSHIPYGESSDVPSGLPGGWEPGGGLQAPPDTIPRTQTTGSQVVSDRDSNLPSPLPMVQTMPAPAGGDLVAPAGDTGISLGLILGGLAIAYFLFKRP